MNQVNLPINEIICGDCLSLMRTWPDACIDLCVTSPPYNLGGFSRNGGRNQSSYDNYPDKLPDEEYKKFIYSMVDEVERILKLNGSLYLNLKYRFKNNQCILPNWAIEKTSLILRNQIIWNYIGYTDVYPNKFYPGYQVIFLLIKDKKNYFFNREKAQIGDVWRIKQARMQGEIYGHPAPFPEEIPKNCIQASSKPGDLIFDPCNGSGTTTKVAKQLGRDYIGIDISEKYCGVARERLRQQYLEIPPDVVGKSPDKASEQLQLFGN